MSDLVERLRSGAIHQAAKDLIDRYFGNTDKCLASIPARPDKDADIVLAGGLMEAADRILKLEDIAGRFWLETQEIRSEIPSDFLLDPPDGGDVKTHEGVAKMRTRIEALEAENAGLREALEPFADLADEIETSAAECDETDAARNPENWSMSCEWADLVRARAALEGRKDG